MSDLLLRHNQYLGVKHCKNNFLLKSYFVYNLNYYRMLYMGNNYGSSDISSDRIIV